MVRDVVISVQTLGETLYNVLTRTQYGTLEASEAEIEQLLVCHGLETFKAANTTPTKAEMVKLRQAAMLVTSLMLRRINLTATRNKPGE